MAKKEEYKILNEEYYTRKKQEEGITELDGTILCKILEHGNDTKKPEKDSVVTVHYRGTLINGKEFDNSWKRGYPEAFRINDLINGFKTALLNMRIGSHYLVYIPWKEGYGKHSNGNIPGYSTLFFEIKLIAIS